MSDADHQGERPAVMLAADPEMERMFLEAIAQSDRGETIPETLLQATSVPESWATSAAGQFTFRSSVSLYSPLRLAEARTRES
jgi:hypothetical protein